MRATLKVYKKLSRIIFLDGEPSPYVLKTAVKDGLVGIPQGCPLAPLGHAWTQCIKQRLPNALKFSYLDDRLLIAPSWQELPDALEYTIKFDEAVPVLNHKQCACTTVGRAGQVPVKRPAHVLPNIMQSKVIKYLGIDLLTDRSVHSQVARIRIEDAMARLELIGRLPSAQRGNLVSDTQASLYCAGGVICSKSQLLQVSRAAARALNGNKNPRMCIARSREATHLVGVGLTRTHAPAAIIVTFIKELWRLLAMQCISSNEWEAQYQRRRFCAAGSKESLKGLCVLRESAGHVRFLSRLPTEHFDSWIPLYSLEPRIGKRQLSLSGGPPSRISSTSSAHSFVLSMLTAWPQLALKILPTSLEAGMKLVPFVRRPILHGTIPEAGRC